MTDAVTALTAIGALVFTGLSLNATRDQVAIAQQQNKVSEQSQYTDRYTKAVELLDRSGVDHLQGRLGAIYALERLSRDSPRDQPTIVEVLSAFIRTSRPTPAAPACPPPQSDTQAALAVLGRRDPTHDNDLPIDLTDTCLNGMDLRGAHLNGANLNGADLSSADLTGASLHRAALRGANLNDANLTEADLRSADLNADAQLISADLSDANLNDAVLNGANLTGADLGNTDLSDAYLKGANLTSAYLGSADLSLAAFNDADLTGADLTAADLTFADLGGADLTGVIHDATTVINHTAADLDTIGQWW